MASVASQLIEEVTAHSQSDSLEDAREICTDGTYFPNNLSIWKKYNGKIFKFALLIAYNELEKEIWNHFRVTNCI